MASSREESPQTGPSFLTLNLLGNSRHSELQRVTASYSELLRQPSTERWDNHPIRRFVGVFLARVNVGPKPWENSHVRGSSLASWKPCKQRRFESGERERAESSAGRMTGSLPRIRADGRRITPKAPGFESVVPDCQGHLPDWGSLTGPIASSRVSDPRITLNRTWEPWWSGQSTLLARHGRACGDPH